jgi:hypothetical protein
MASEGFHELHQDLTPFTRDLHRAILSLMEELEAIDWYQQRVDATSDEDLRVILPTTVTRKKNTHRWYLNG